MASPVFIENNRRFLSTANHSPPEYGIGLSWITGAGLKSLTQSDDGGGVANYNLISFILVYPLS